MVENKIREGYRTRRCLAIVLVLALLFGNISLVKASGSAVASAASSTISDSLSSAHDGMTDDDAVFRLATWPTTLQDAMSYFSGKISESYTTDEKAKAVLSSMLLSDIRSLLQLCINTSDFQNTFLSVIEEYEILNQTSLGVVSYASELIEEGTNQYIQMYNHLVTLYDYAEKALRSIYTAYQEPRTAANLSTFLNKMVDNSDSMYKQVNNYVGEFDKFSGYEKLQTTLLGGDAANRNEFRYYMLTYFPKSSYYLAEFGFTDSDGYTLPAMGTTTTDPTYKDLYDSLLNVYKVEKAYDNLKYTKDSTEPIRSKMGSTDNSKFEYVSADGLSDGLYTVYTKLSASIASGGLGSQGEADAFIRSLFNGNDILNLIGQYIDLKSFISALDSLPENITTSEQISKAVDTYNKYLALTDSEKAKLSADDLTKLAKCIPAEDSIGNVISLISAITYPTTETAYRNTFLPAYQKAETAYNALLVLYPNMGIENFVDNRALLTGDYKTFQTYQNRIFEALAIEDVNVCNKLATVISPLRSELQSLSKSNVTVFNHLIGYSTLETMFTDATAAKALRDRVDVLRLSPTADDTAELTKIKNEVSALNAKAKAYFGTLYEQYIQALEYGTYTDDVNMAARVDTLIERIGTVTANSGSKIEAARSAYNSLTTLQKSLVKNYNTLVSAEKTFGELNKDISYASVTNIKTGYVYTHSEIRPEPVVKVGGVTLTQGVHYTVSYSNNKNVGTATVTIQTISGGGYTGTFTKTFIIVKDSVKNCGVSGLKKKYTYTGKKIKPAITVTVNGFTTKKGSDYKLTYKKNKKVGTAKIKIKGIGNYKGSRTVTFKIVRK